MKSQVRHSPVQVAALLALLAMFGPFTIDAFFPAMQAVAKTLQASDWQMQQTISVYLWSYALMSLFHGPLSDTYGRRPVILGGVVVFIAASIGCANATSIEQLLVFRSLQGFSAGAGYIVGRALVRDLYDGTQALKVQSMISMFFGVAPIVAPVIGALVFSLAGWHAVFWFLALYGAGLWLLCWRVLPETHPQVARTPFRPSALFAVYKRLILDQRFVLLALTSGFNFGAFFLYISSVPAFVEKLLGLGKLGYPWFFGPTIGGIMVGAAIANRLAGRLPPRVTVRLGYTVMIAAQLLNLAYNLSTDAIHVPWAVLPIALNTIGIAIASPSLMLKTLDRYPSNRGAASSVQACAWGIMTGTIAGVMSALVSNSGLHLALGSALLTGLGFLAWRTYVLLAPSLVEQSAAIPRPEETIEPA